MKAQRTSSSYCYNLSVKDYKKIESWDDYVNCDTKSPENDSLYYILGKVKGVYGVDYNGHFGPNIYYTIEETFDTLETHDLIESIIENQAKKKAPKAYQWK